MNNSSSSHTSRLHHSLRVSLFVAGLVCAGLPTQSAFAEQRAGAPGQTCYFGECLPQAATSAAATPNNPIDRLRILARNGNWTVAGDDDHIFIGLKFEDGARFAILRTSRGYSFSFEDRNWRLQEGQTYELSAEINGMTISGKGTAASGSMVIVQNVSTEFFRQMVNADSVTFKVAGATWKFAPTGALSAIEAISRTD